MVHQRRFGDQRRDIVFVFDWYRGFVLLPCHQQQRMFREQRYGFSDGLFSSEYFRPV